MAGNDRLRALSEHGVSIWLDDLSRERIATGGLAAAVRDRHVAGVTTNPTIFRNAIVRGTSAYAAQLRELARQGVGAAVAVERLTTTDVRDAADVLRPVYERTDGRDGRVSIEVDPGLAHDTAGTVKQARRLWEAIDRPNVLIKVPATPAGLPAITDLVAHGISVNVTLIFALSRYAAVHTAYMEGVEQAIELGADPAPVRSVASLFVSRLDTYADRRLDAIGTGEARRLRGLAGLANARLAHRRHVRDLESGRWRALAAAGAHRQRLLWTSTSVKDPAYPDTYYTAGLAIPGTVNTLPESAIDAFADHGSVGGAVPEESGVFRALADLGIGYDEMVRRLEADGIAQFLTSWRDLLGVVERYLSEEK
ncbi:transaldolase [Nonomuraea sp. NPDC050540]|uniref:transaldolase n=1 Tax=Nonomuraea sp. NPDC050540 TaxID=3364367 RepID=UPI00378BE28B